MRILGREIHGVFAAPVDFRVAFLAAETFHFAHSHPLDPHFRKGVLDLLQFERFDYRFNFLHKASGRPRQRARLISNANAIDALSAQTIQESDI